MLMWVRGKAMNALAAKAKWRGRMGVVVDVLMWMRISSGLSPEA